MKKASKTMDKAETVDTTTNNPPPTADSNGGKQPIQGKKFQGWHLDPNDITIVGLDTEDDESHPLYDPRIKLPVSEAMVLNIMQHGVLEPILVTKDGLEMRVVDGRRRTIHAREANERLRKAGLDTVKVPCIVKQGDNKTLFGMGQVANRFRVNSGPMESAKAALRYTNLGASVQEIANAFECSEQHVRDLLKMNELAPEVQNAMLKDELTATAALMLTPLPKAEQVAVLKELQDETKEANKKKATVEQAKKAVAKRGGQPGDRVAPTPKERVEKAITILTKFSGVPDKERTKDMYHEVVQKVSRALAGKALDKLVEETDEE